MKVHIVCYEDIHGWILGKFALKLQEHLQPLGIAATISKQPDPRADINHHIIYYDYDGRKTTTETVMVTHIDTDWKRERLRQQLINAAMGICCSAESVDALAAAGLPREKLCFVNPGHDGEMRARRTVIGITSKVQPSGCKREGILLDLAQRISPDEFQFRIMGAGWDEHVKNLRLAGFTVDHWKAFDRPEYLKLMPSLDYYLYLGLDEGSMGYMDALAAGVQTIVTTQGFHLDAPGGITHGWSEPAELFRIFESIARDKRLRQQAVANWTWPEYAKRHFALWNYLLAQKAGQALPAALRAPLNKMAVLTTDATFAAPTPNGARTPTSAAASSVGAASHNPTLPASLPLPAGEGRGEGERSVAPMRRELLLPSAVADPILDHHGVHPWFKHTLRDRADRWESWQTCHWLAAQLPKDAPILDLGCGVGFNLFWFGEQGFRALDGQDLSPENVGAAQELAQRTGSSARFWTDNALQPQRPLDRAYGAILALNFTHCAEGCFSLADFLATYEPHLQPNGVLVFDAIDPSYGQVADNQFHTADAALPPAQRRPSEYINRLGRADVEAACAARGFGICHTVTHPQRVPKIIYFLQRIAVAAQPTTSAAPGVPPLTMPAELAAQFTMNGLMATEQWYHNETAPAGQSLVFPRAQVEEFKQRIARREPGSYAPTNGWLYEALARYQLAGQHVAILGSEAPWYEAMCLHYGARCTTIEYRPILTDHPEIHALTPAQYAANPVQFDAAFSISSFEHDGLGRYGDPIAPDADLEAMRKLHALVKPGGLLFLAVPVGKDIVVWNAHRIYGRHRLPRLLEGWKIVDAFGFDQPLFDHDTKGSGEERNYIQPVFVLQNTAPAPDETIFTFRKPVDETAALEAEIAAALAADPHHREALTALLSLRLDQSRWAEAAKAAFQLLQQTPDDATVLTALAHCLEQCGEHETAAAVREQLRSGDTRVPEPTPATCSTTDATPTADKSVRSTPRILLIADVPNWIFHRHCQELTARLGDEFIFTTKFAGEPFNEADFDLIYPLEFNLVDAARVGDPRKYITGIRSHCTWQRLGFEQSIAKLKASFAHVHAVSTRLQRIFAPHVPSLTLLSHGVDTDFFQPRAQTMSPAGKLRLGWAGNRLSPNKGFAELIAPLGQIPGVELVFCGYADKNLNREQMREFYASVDAVVCASDFEGNNNTLLEAAAMARAIVTTDTGTVPEYLTHGASALIVERTLPALTAAVATLRDQPSLRAQLGTAARASVVAKFSWATAAEAHRAFFRAALASAAPEQPDYDQIEQLARQALAENPDGVEALALLAQSLLQHNNFAECARVCLRLLALDDTHLNALAMLAKCFFQANELPAARTSLERILELDPTNALARENLAALAQLQADSNGARKPTSAASSAEAKPAADMGVRAPLPAELQPEMAAVTAAYAAGDLPAAHAILHRLFKANPDSDALRELAGESTALIRAACPVPDFGDAIKPARLNIALMTFNALAYTKLCLASLKQHSTEPYNVFIVDNGSTDGTREWLAEQTDDNLFVEFSPANLGVPGGRNRLLQLIQPHLRTSDFVIFMDNDIEVMPGWVEHFSNFFATHPHVGIGTAVGHLFQVRGEVRELGAVPVDAPTPVDVACGGFVCWVRAAAAAAVGEYDEKLGLFWHEDDDYTVRALAAGWEVFIVPGAPVLHHEHKSGAAKPGIKVGGSPANQRYLANKWRALGLLDANGKPKRPQANVGQRVSPELQTQVSAQSESVSQADGHDTLSSFKARRARVTLPVRWAAPFFNPTGYASEAINFVLPLSHQANVGIFHDTNITSEAFTADLPAADRDRLLALRDKFVLMPGGVLVTHNPAFAFKRTPDALYHVGRTMYETDRIPADWVTCCNAMDEVWVPSQFNVETFANSGVLRDKLVVIPGAVDENLFDPAKHTPLPLPNAAKFNFVSVFEWSARKAWDVLLAAYLREFSAADDVCLHLRTYLFCRPDVDPRTTLEPLIREFAAKLDLGNKALPRIQLLAEQIPTGDLPRLYLAADCVVVPSRGEGWGRPMHEAMAMGRPVIATGWSANTEFMNADNSYLLDYELVEVKGIEPYLKHYLGHRWAQPSEKHLRELMRRVKENPAEAAAKGAKAREHVTKHFSRAAVAEKVMQRLEAIERKFTTPSCGAVRGANPLVRRESVAAASKNTGDRSVPVTVAWDGSFLDYGSLSHVNRELTGALEKLPGVRLTRLGQANLNAPAALAEVARSLKSVAPTGTQVTVRHAWPPVWDAPARGKWVQIQPWEFGALPAEWARGANRADEIWCYSDYVRREYLAAGLPPEKIHVVPLGIDAARFHPSAKPLPLATRKSFKFLFVGGTIGRKGADVLLRAYLDTFTAADDVCLVIKDFGGKSVYQGQTLDAQIRAAQQSANAPEILYLTEELAPESIAGLFTACDCLVHPYRGEGFGLPVLEAMACGLPVVCTGGGSTDDFATDEFAYRLPATRRPIGNKVGELELVARGWLLEPSLPALSATLRRVRSHPDEARAKGRAASEHVRANWTWQQTAKVAAERLRALAGQSAPVLPAAYSDSTVARGGDTVSPRRRKFELKLPPVGLIGDLASARAAFAQNQPRMAWHAAVEALRIRPFHPEAWLLLAEIAQSVGDTVAAKTCASRARELTPNWKPAKQLAKQLARGGDPKPGLTAQWAAMPVASAAPRLSIFVIAKNEEKFLGQCLASVKGLADQLIVVDTGSTDRTVEIARAHGAEVHTHPWADDFSAARNAALVHATGDWVLFLDADEELPPAEHAKLRAELSAPGTMAVRLRLQNAGQEEDGLCYVPRLWRNAPGLFFYGRIHEQVFPSILVKCEAWGMETKLGTATLRHHGYDAQLVKDRNKVERNLRLLRQAIQELPGEPMLLMNLGLELVRSGQLAEGLTQYRTALRELDATPREDVVPELREALLTQLVCHLHTAKEFTELLEVLGSATAKAAGPTASMHFMGALACLQLKRFADGAAHARQCLAKRNQPVLSPVNRDILKSGPHHVLALCLWGAGRHEDVEAAFLKALAADAGAKDARLDFARWLAERGRPVDALALLNQLVEAGDTAPRAWVLGAQIALGDPRLVEFAGEWTGEAVRHQPADQKLAALRAEALLLGGRAAEAARVMAALEQTSVPMLAAAVLAALGAGEQVPAVEPAAEPVVSAEFLRWYRRLIDHGTMALLTRVNDGLTELGRVLPTAARVLAAAMTEAQTAESPDALAGGPAGKRL